MNRRTAISTLSLAALTLSSAGSKLSAAIDPSSAVKKKRSKDKPIRVALIGARNMGGKTHLPSLVGNVDCELVAICDVDKQVVSDAVKDAGGLYAESGRSVSIEGIGDYREVMANREIDAVVIATPDHWHVPIAKAAVLAGKDVYVEKPLSLYVTEGRELIDVAKDRDVIVQIGSQHRSTDRFLLSSAIVQSGMLGRIKHTKVAIHTRPGLDAPFESQPIPPELDYDMWVGPVMWTDYNSERVHYNFRFVSDFSGGEIANWGAHYLDSAQQALGLDKSSPIRVEGAGKRRPAGGVHSSFYDIDVKYEYEGGVTMSFESSSDYPTMGITFYGEKATLFVNRDSLTIDNPDLMRALPKKEAKAFRKTKGSHMSNWFDCMRSRKKEDLHAPLEIAHRSAILCHLANMSIEVGRPLQWDPEKEIFVNDALANALLNRPERKKYKV